MKKILKPGLISSLTIVTTLVAASYNHAIACQPDAYMGSICVTGANYCPRDYVPLNGQLLDIAQLSAVYALMGITYGGDGRVSFGVADAKGRELIHNGQGPGLLPYIWGQYTGVEAFELPYNYMPQHTHNIDFSNAPVSASLNVSNSSASEVSPSGSYFAVSSTGAENYNNTSNATMANPSVIAQLQAPEMATGNTPPGPAGFMSLVGPQLGLTVCVAIDGLFPPRPN